jgi:hypothetical protein
MIHFRLQVFNLFSVYGDVIRVKFLMHIPGVPSSSRVALYFSIDLAVKIYKVLNSLSSYEHST